jgi:hypothetical protein
MDRWHRELVRDLRPFVCADEADRVALTANVDLFTELEAAES